MNTTEITNTCENCAALQKKVDKCDLMQKTYSIFKIKLASTSELIQKYKKIKIRCTKLKRAMKHYKKRMLLDKRYEKLARYLSDEVAKLKPLKTINLSLTERLELNRRELSTAKEKSLAYEEVKMKAVALEVQLNRLKQSWDEAQASIKSLKKELAKAKKASGGKKISLVNKEEADLNIDLILSLKENMSNQETQINDLLKEKMERDIQDINKIFNKYCLPQEYAERIEPLPIQNEEQQLQEERRPPKQEVLEMPGDDDYNLIEPDEREPHDLMEDISQRLTSTAQDYRVSRVDLVQTAPQSTEVIASTAEQSGIKQELPLWSLVDHYHDKDAHLPIEAYESPYIKEEVNQGYEGDDTINPPPTTEASGVHDTGEEGGSDTPYYAHSAVEAYESPYVKEEVSQRFYDDDDVISPRAASPDHEVFNPLPLLHLDPHDQHQDQYQDQDQHQDQHQDQDHNLDQELSAEQDLFIEHVLNTSTVQLYDSALVSEILTSIERDTDVVIGNDEVVNSSAGMLIANTDVVNSNTGVTINNNSDVDITATDRNMHAVNTEADHDIKPTGVISDDTTTADIVDSDVINKHNNSLDAYIKEDPLTDGPDVASKAFAKWKGRKSSQLVGDALTCIENTQQNGQRIGSPRIEPECDLSSVDGDYCVNVGSIRGASWNTADPTPSSCGDDTTAPPSPQHSSREQCTSQLPHHAIVIATPRTLDSDDDSALIKCEPIKDSQHEPITDSQSRVEIDAIPSSNSEMISTSAAARMEEEDSTRLILTTTKHQLTSPNTIPTSPDIKYTPPNSIPMIHDTKPTPPDTILTPPETKPTSPDTILTPPETKPTPPDTRPSVLDAAVLTPVTAALSDQTHPSSTLTYSPTSTGHRGMDTLDDESSNSAVNQVASEEQAVTCNEDVTAERLETETHNDVDATISDSCPDKSESSLSETYLPLGRNTYDASKSTHTSDISVKNMKMDAKVSDKSLMIKNKKIEFFKCFVQASHGHSLDKPLSESEESSDLGVTVKSEKKISLDLEKLKCQQNSQDIDDEIFDLPVVSPLYRDDKENSISEVSESEIKKIKKKIKRELKNEMKANCFVKANLENSLDEPLSEIEESSDLGVTVKSEKKISLDLQKLKYQQNSQDIDDEIFDLPVVNPLSRDDKDKDESISKVGKSAIKKSKKKSKRELKREMKKLKQERWARALLDKQSIDEDTDIVFTTVAKTSKDFKFKVPRTHKSITVSSIFKEMISAARISPIVEQDIRAEEEFVSKTCAHLNIEIENIFDIMIVNERITPLSPDTMRYSDPPVECTANQISLQTMTTTNDYSEDDGFRFKVPASPPVAPGDKAAVVKFVTAQDTPLRPAKRSYSDAPHEETGDEIVPDASRSDGDTGLADNSTPPNCDEAPVRKKAKIKKRRLDKILNYDKYHKRSAEYIVTKFELRNRFTLEEVLMNMFAILIETDDYSLIQNESLINIASITDEWIPQLTDNEKWLISIVREFSQPDQIAEVIARCMNVVLMATVDKENSFGKESVSRFFTELCRNLGLIENVRIFVYDCLLHNIPRSAYFIVGVASVWPQSITFNPDNNGFIVSCLQLCLSRALTNTKTDQKIKRFLSTVLQWTLAENVSIPLLTCYIDLHIKTMMNFDTDLSKVNGISFGLKLLGNQMPWTWVLEELVKKHLLVYVILLDTQSTIACELSHKVTLVLPILVSIYQHQLQYKSCAKDIKKFARILEKLLVKMNVPSSLKERLAESLIHLVDDQRVYIMQALITWFSKKNTNYKISEVVKFNIYELAHKYKAVLTKSLFNKLRLK